MTKTAVDSEQVRETIYRLDGPLRWALGEAYELLDKVGVRAGDTVLDVGAGTGYLSLPLAEAVGAGGQVHCVDVSSELLKVLERKATRRGLAQQLRLRHCSALTLPYPQATFDYVFSSYCLHELDTEAPAVLAETYRVLKPLGRLVVADYRRIADEERRCEIEAWYARQDDGGGADELHLRFDLVDMERLLLAAGYHDLHLSTWLDFHMHAVARK